MSLNPPFCLFLLITKNSLNSMEEKMEFIKWILHLFSWINQLLLLLFNFFFILFKKTNCVSFGDKIFDKCHNTWDRDEIKNCDILFCFMFKKRRKRRNQLALKNDETNLICFIGNFIIKIVFLKKNKKKNLKKKMKI